MLLFDLITYNIADEDQINFIKSHKIQILIFCLKKGWPNLAIIKMNSYRNSLERVRLPLSVKKQK